MTSPISKASPASTPSSPQSLSDAPSARAFLIAITVLILAPLAAYHNTFHVPFLFDDTHAIVENPTIRQLSHLGEIFSPPSDTGTTVNGRPLVNLTLALNYAVGGLDVRGYHAVNLAIHVLAGLLLFGIVRRTALTPVLRSRFGPAALPLAFATSLLWLLHPLQTESVTYVVQRAESLAALFFLLTFYAFLVGQVSDLPTSTPDKKKAGQRPALPPTSSPRTPMWRALACVACLAGVATKEIAAVAPVLVFLFDRTFLPGSFHAAWQARSRFYFGLAASWLLLGVLVLSATNRGGTAGFNVGVLPFDYALTQCRAIVLYLRLVVWPAPLVFDYGMNVEKSARAVLPHFLVLAALFGTTLFALRRFPALGFLGAWFFLILGPTSSIVPITTQTMAEHRLYLPLAAICTLAVFASFAWLGQRAFIAIAVCSIACGFLTERRNRDYASDLTLWRDTVEKRPQNARAQNNLGRALIESGDTPAAMARFKEALRLLPSYPETHNNLGYALAQTGRPAEAVPHFEESLRLRPTNPRAHDNLGNALVQLHRLPEAIAHFQEALRLRPDFADSHWGLGNALTQSERLSEAITHYETALRLDPAFADVHYSLGAALAQTGRTAEAIVHYREALRLKPNFPEAENNLGNLALAAGRSAEAIAHYRGALAVKSSYAEARVNLANAMLESGAPADALKEYQTALATDASNPDVHYGLASTFVQLERLPEAVSELRETLRIKPDHLPARVNLGNALILSGHVAEAIAQYELALKLAPDDPALRANLDQARQLQRSRPPPLPR